MKINFQFYLKSCYFIVKTSGNFIYSKFPRLIENCRSIFQRNKKIIKVYIILICNLLLLLFFFIFSLYKTFLILLRLNKKCYGIKYILIFYMYVSTYAYTIYIINIYYTSFCI